MIALPQVFLDRPIAHRALHDGPRGFPENGLSAVGRAVQAGYPIEIDVQVSGDGVAMVFHDRTLDRMTSAHGPVKDRTARDLADLRLSGSSDAVPTLREVLDRVAGRVPVLVELKDQSGGLGPADDMLERAVADDLSTYVGPVAVMSFNPYMVAEMQRLAPDVPRGLATCGFIPSQWPGLDPDICARLRAIEALDTVGAGFISHAWADLGSPRVADLKARGLPILCWTVTSPEIEQDARRVADNITFEGYLPAIDGAVPPHGPD